MKRIILFLVLLAATALAHEDRLAFATYLHTKVELPAPDKAGEIIAEFNHDRDKARMSFRSLTIKIGSKTIDVPKRICDFFEGPQPATMQLLIGPPDSANSKTPGYFAKGYFRVTFRFGSIDYEGVGWGYSDDKLTGSITIQDGRVQGVEIYGGPQVKVYDADLKEVDALLAREARKK